MHEISLTWQRSNWQNNKLTARQIISFTISVALILLVLLIPVALHIHKVAPVPILAIELVKQDSASDIVEEPMPEFTPDIQAKPKPATQESIKHKMVEKKDITKAKDLEPRTIMTVKPKVENTITKIPSSGVIFSSLRNRKVLQNVDKDFQKSNNDFINKNMVTKKQPSLFTNKSILKNLSYSEKSKGQKRLTGVVGFFAPMQDKEKTQDSLSYCQALGRRSVFCPSNNPLN